jgi:hypothetical protein
MGMYEGASRGGTSAAPRTRGRSAIGTTTPAEWTSGTAPTGRPLMRLTEPGSNAYPLYYFTPSVTPDGRWLVFHSERSGQLQLYRLDLTTGEVGQLTDGHTQDAGWAIWCEWRLDGIYNHLSAIHPARGEVWYFEEDELRATAIDSFAHRLVAKLPAGSMPIGQTAFSPDGRWFAYIHANTERYVALLREREAKVAAGTFDWDRDHQAFRNRIGMTLALVDTVSGEQRPVIETDFHFHHVLFVDDETMLINHPRNAVGMWVIKRDGSGRRELRPASAPGAHGASVNHQVITARGIAYEAVGWTAKGRENWLGLYDMAGDSFTEGRLPVSGYAHVGYDPAGRFAFIECASPRHEILTVHGTEDPQQLEVRVLHALRSPDHNDQRFHAHPFLAADRRWLYFTDLSEQGFAQICRLDVSDVVAT